MEESKWKKFKKNDSIQIINKVEVLVFTIGFIIFYYFDSLKVIYIMSVIISYWLWIRYYEKQIIEKKRDIYNVYYDNCEPVAQFVIDGRTARDRKPLEYDLEQLENKRKFLVDKFMVLNLIMVVLIELFIKNIL
jgi:hypothetical protein